ncbi:MotA/TolQ/ExbB proton channel family protein, partial [Lysobacter aestuarii]
MQRVLTTALASALLLPILAACNAQPDADTAAPAPAVADAAPATDTADAA